MKEKDFPILRRKINGKKIIYFDNAATTQKPLSVINSITSFYKKNYANVHRAIATLGEEATQKYEEARKKVARFINANPEEIIFVKSTTEAINLVAYSLSLTNIFKKNDCIVSSIMEHHSNMLPWQRLARIKKLRHYFIGLNNNQLNLSQAAQILEKKPKLVALTHVSNVLGCINPLKQLIRIAHKNDSLFFIDGAQSVPHLKIDVKALDTDFLAFSGHKMYGPSGVGVLYIRKDIAEQIPPFLLGGSMIKDVTLKKVIWNDIPYKFEAGTPNIEGVVGLGAAIDYLTKIGMSKIMKYEKELTEYAIRKLKKIKSLKLYIPPKNRTSIISFNMGKLHPHDLATLLDMGGIQIRAGYHCAQPLVQKLSKYGVARISFSFYNTKKEIDYLADVLKKIEVEKSGLIH